MKHTLKKLSDTSVQVTVTLDGADLTTAKKAAIAHLAPNVKVAGFRKGKVPANVVEKNVDPTALANETVEHAINIAVNDIAVAEQLRVLDQPSIDLKDFKPYDEMKFEATMEILPEITLGDYKKLKVKKDPIEVTEPEIDEVIVRMQTQFSEKKDVTRAAKEGDEVTIDFTGMIDDVPFDGGSASDYALVLGSKSFIPGFEEAIVGRKVGEEFNVPLTFPKDYQAENLKGAKSVFAVNLKGIKEVVLPKLDTEFAAKLGPFKTMKEVRADILRELTAQKDRTVIEKFKDDLIGALVEVSNVPIPQVLVDDQAKSIEQDAMQNLMYRGMTAEQYMEQHGYKTHEEWHEKEFNQAAVRRVQAGLILSELSKLEKVEVTTEELEARHAEMLSQYPNMKDELDKPAARRDLANRLITEKTVDRLVELNA